jgi:hypothetical protein
MELAHAKQELLIPALWKKLGLAGELPQLGRASRCPFPDRHHRGDKNPSFGIYAGGRRFKCHGCGAGGSAVDLVAEVLSLDSPTACRKFVELAGGDFRQRLPAVALSYPSVPPQTSETKPLVQIPSLDGAGIVRIDQLAKSRALSREAVQLALRLGTLAFAEVAGQSCWLLQDPTRYSAEARRLDRKIFPELGKLGERRAHSLTNTQKSWPLGLGLMRTQPYFQNVRAVMMVEGGPDYLAALHFLYAQEVDDVLPVTMLGRTTGGRIHPEALSLLRGRRVRIYCHDDADGGGIAAGKKWAGQLKAVGCQVDGFQFGGLMKQDGSAAKDLNDCTELCDEHKGKLEGLLP